MSALKASPESAREALRALVLDRLGDSPAAHWLREHTHGLSVDAARTLMPEVGRQLGMGKAPLVSAFAERDRASVVGVHGRFKVGHWTLDGAARALVLAGAVDAAEHPTAALSRCYDLGDTETRVAALRAVQFVRCDDPEPALEMVRDAGRTYLNELMDAAWCDNPFTSDHLTDAEFRKAVLKAFFVNVPVGRFQRLAERADAELAQSLCEYADEREAAGRPVPSAVWSIAALHPRPGLVARLIGKLEHPSVDERLAAASALENARDARALSFIAERLGRESDRLVKDALERAAAATPRA